ncbi:MAG: hypothetical protein LBU61_02690 [Coriobacteriales bacterium]|nr:hypothetical protein [Coriobacteriales bacterium]
MKALVLSVTAGGGHLAAAQAISGELESRGATTTVLDIYEYLNKFIHTAIDKGYTLSTERVSVSYRALYSFLENRQKTPLDKLDPVTLVNMLCAMRFERFTDSYDPDCIICTHPLAAQIVNGLITRKKIAALTIGIITDFTILPYWEACPEIDYVVIAGEMLRHRAISRGISIERLLPIGIPIKSKFAISINKSTAREQLSLPQDLPMVLVMAGSMGYGKIEKVIEELLVLTRKLFVVAVCGNNQKLFETLIELNGGQSRSDRLLVYGYSDQIDLLMDAVDCIITKPGGLTVSEALAKRLPMILVSPIPGQEERNTEFLMNTGAAIRVTRTLPIDEAVSMLFDNPGRVRIMRESIDMISKPRAVHDLVDFIYRHT